MKKTATKSGGPSLAEVHFRNAKDWNEAAKSMVDYVDDVGKALLASKADVNESDRAILKAAVADFMEAAFGLSASIADLGKGADVPGEFIAKMFAKVIAGSFVIGLSGVSSGEAKKHLQDMNAFHARMARKHSPEEIALRSAIDDERGVGPVERPWKEADRILAGVNARLKQAGQKEVKVGAVYLRLKDIHAL